jgi:hypothetical protein
MKVTQDRSFVLFYCVFFRRNVLLLCSRDLNVTSVLWLVVAQIRTLSTTLAGPGS